jgi:hypothetical protein
MPATDDPGWPGDPFPPALGASSPRPRTVTLTWRVLTHFLALAAPECKAGYAAPAGAALLVRPRYVVRGV